MAQSIGVSTRAATDCVQESEHNPSYHNSESEEEAIVVTREEEEIDPEDEADFDREYAKIMAESFETRKFERKQQFDIPLPVRPKNRELASGSETAEGGTGTPGGTMAFSLLTKRGNRQQVSAMRYASHPLLCLMHYRPERSNCPRTRPLLLP